MEEDLGRLEAANELRIRSSEQQWEFVIPATFSTRSGGANGADSSSSGLLQSLMGTLNSFFSLRGSGTGSGSSGSNGRGVVAGRQQLMAELLPPDYRADLSLSDVMYEAAALEAGSSGSSSSSNGGSATTGADAAGAAAASTSGQQQQQAEWSAEAGSNSSGGSGSFGAVDSRVGGRSEQLLGEQQRLGRAAGLQRRPARPPSSNWK
jgi:hypothetical protein